MHAKVLYDDQILQIEQEILSGDRVAGKHLIQAVKRHYNDLEHGAERGIYFDIEIANHALEFAEALRDYRGEFSELFWWHRMELYYTFGWRRTGGARRFRTKYISMARKNQKTITRPANIFFHILFEDEYAPEVYISATKEDQAKICFDDVKTILGNNPELSSMFTANAENIFSHEYKAKIKFLTSNPKTADGTRPTYAIIDEYHEFDDDGMIDKLTTGMINRNNQLLEIITTRGVDKYKPCYQREQKVFLPVLYGEQIQDSILVFIFAPDPEDENDIENPLVWQKANPNLGHTIKLETFKEMLDKARLGGSSSLNKFRTLNLNIWVDADEEFVEAEKWAQGSAPTKIEDFYGKECTVSLDLAMTEDFCAMCVSFPNGSRFDEDWMEELIFTQFWYFWIPKHTVDKRVSQGLSAIKDWIYEGWVTVVNSDFVSHSDVEAKLLFINSKFKVKECVFDKWNIGSIAEVGSNAGIEMVEFQQTITNYTGPTKWFKQMASTGRIKHGGNPVMKWMLRNAVVIEDTNGNVRVTKSKKQSKGKVDGVIASIMAVGAEYYREEQSEPFFQGFD